MTGKQRVEEKKRQDKRNLSINRIIELRRVQKSEVLIYIY
jgi:hypothetical protein